MARETHDLFRAFYSAHGVVFEPNIPVLLRAPALACPVALTTIHTDLTLTVADVPGQALSCWQRTFMVVATPNNGDPRLSGMTSFGALNSLETSVATWHALHELLLSHPDPRWKAFGWAAELFRLVGDAQQQEPVAAVKTMPARHRRKLAA